jgi:hypothetical protein
MICAMNIRLATAPTRIEFLGMSLAVCNTNELPPTQFTMLGSAMALVIDTKGDMYGYGYWNRHPSCWA